MSGYTWNISYGDGSGASGNVYADKVVIGAATATSQAVEAATSVSSQFTADTNNDGLVGLAFSSINTVRPNPQTTFFDTVKGGLSQKLFTATLKAGKPGSYDFGFIDSTKYKGSIVYVPVDSSQGFWEFTADGYSVGSGASSGAPINAIADTGTSLLLLDDNIVDDYWSRVNGAAYDDNQGGYTFPCSATLPTFSFIISGKAISGKSALSHSVRARLTQPQLPAATSTLATLPEPPVSVACSPTPASASPSSVMFSLRRLLSFST